ncbi:small GTP-binding protein Rab7 [Leishmania donovani]|uniref:Small_GTP-binding_protein_Rab7_-_putative n=3 Tax=Leishmania donovani species complex TaxID=38574 RepID=A0A6L0WJU2_LEIIN|nr:putative small GTP-binding protein Rab7 [Leishmania infantum JPCM5]TPP52569.1 Ras family protein [Leishmania donovani]CAC9458920.1 small_GTP-binding_protein_Rab7_-_putative [Leishmania infantum]CAJ1986806.1 small GTP-binding protein Rab7 [Leishmania donovani]CAM66138.1 putative small GTP-binding protein Rab7 [Leishmania infantum JPCM5]SUZ39760.1 small_GTP-binding_protein_Rab7_-_putative [Leishmania infantum]|eukprot:XP_001463770.1 putative small GTP-binding protein Rab7 [Leishmania infantum JPCM5]
MEEDLAYKIIVIGSVSVGKSNITSRFCDGAFYPDLVPTLGMDFKYSSCNTLEKRPRCVRLQVWDTSGQDDFVTLTTAFYRNCQGALLCFDLTNRQSFEDLDQWYERLERYSPVVPPLILVGCKLDLVESHLDEQGEGIVLGSHRQIAKSEADAWARYHSCLCYLETSAKENTNVSQAFQQLATYIASVANPGAKHAGRILGPGGRLLVEEEEKQKKRQCCAN